MMMRAAVVLALSALALAVAPAQEKKSARPGEKIPGTYPSYNVTGPRAGRLHDHVTQHDLNPVVAVFARAAPDKAADPLAGLLLKLEAAVAERKAEKVGGFVVFLNLTDEFYKVKDDVREARVAEADNLSKLLKLQNVVVGLDHPNSPAAKAFGLAPAGPDAKGPVVTVLVYDRHVVKDRLNFDNPLNDMEAKAAWEKIEAALPQKKK
jgi:hypothetical protein